MLQTAELLKKVRKLEIVTRRKVTDAIPGAYHSVLKGRGSEFDEVREYTFEDDVRDIDWNVSARLNAPFVKKYVEERELTVLLMVDTSSSMYFGPAGSKVCERAVEAAAMLGLSAMKNNDRVGLMLFSDRVEKLLMPRSGRHNRLRLIRELIAAAGTGQPRTTDIASALRHGCSILKKRSVIFLISDLTAGGAELEKALRIASRRHEVIVLHVFEPAMFVLPREVKNIYDAESGIFHRISSRRSIRKVVDAARQQMDINRSMCRRSGADLLELAGGQDVATELMKYFLRRKKQRNNSFNGS